MINEAEYNANITRLTGEISKLQGYLAQSASLHHCKNSVWSSPCGSFGSASYCDQKTNFPGMERGEGQKFVARVKENHQQWVQCINGKISQAKQNLLITRLKSREKSYSDKSMKLLQKFVLMKQQGRLKF